MNHIYRVIFNQETGTFQAVSEIVRTSRKSHSSKGGHLPKILLTPLSVAVTLLSSQAFASPTGGQVTAGVATINQAGNITNINQSSQNAAINWQSFNVGKNETVNFNQPNAQSVTLNRVIGNERSVIDGAMNANGKVFISNANGMLIGKDAKINVGSLVATTANISDDDLMNGRYSFAGEGTGSIENLGHISVPKGGVVALVTPIVKNGGTITAPQGNVLLASAESFSITLPDNANFAYTLDKGTLQGLVDNGGAILADAGRVVLTAKGVDTVKKSLIKHSGNIEANTVQNKNGVIELLGDQMNINGNLKAEAQVSGSGGLIHLSASEINSKNLNELSTNSVEGLDGNLIISTPRIIVSEKSFLNGNDVSKLLKSNNVTLHSSNEFKEFEDRKIYINDNINWSENTLELAADKSINIQSDLNAEKEGKLSLYSYYGDVNISKGSKINLPEGISLASTSLSGGGYDPSANTFKIREFGVKYFDVIPEKYKYQVIHSLPKINENGDGGYTHKSISGEYGNYKKLAIGADIDLSFTKNLKNFNGWEASYVHMLGLGHKIKNLTLDVNRPDLEGAKIGLFSHFNGTIKDLYAENIDIKALVNHGYVGGIVGWGANFDNFTGTYSTTLENVHMNGKIRVDAASSTVGGIIARNSDVNIDGMVKNSSADVDISVKSKNGDYIHMGGIAGHSNVENVASSGNLNYTGNSDLEDYTGAWGSNEIGGLVGYGNVVSSYSDINLNIDFDHPGNIEIGGLVGGGLVNDSYYEGDMNVRIGKSKVGGVWQDSNKQHGEIGGLIGSTAGYNPDAVRSSYFNGNIKVDSHYNSAVGALVGEFLAHYHKIKTSYYNKDKTSLKAVGLATELAKPIDYPLELHKSSDSELKTKSTFKDWDFDNVWYMNEGSMPKLRAFATPLAINPTAQTTAGVKAPDLSKTYDGKAITSVDDLKKLDGWKDNFDATGLTTGDSVDGIFQAGTLTIDESKGDWKGAKDVKEGGYELYPTGTLKDEYQQKYIIDWQKGTLTIDKKPITIAVNSYYDGTDTAKIYDKNDKFFGKQIMGFNGIVKGDDVSLKLGATGTLNSNQAGNTTLKDLGNLALEGASANNYTINKDGSTWTINKRPIKVTGSREYNGSEWVNGADLNIDKSDIVGKDQILLNVYTGDAKLDGKDTKNGRKIVDTSKIYFGGKDGENYEIDTSRSLVDITPKNISVEVSKEYDGTNEFTKGFKIKGIIDGENPNIHISKATVAGKDNISDDVDYDKFTSISIAMPDKNYKFENGNGNVVARILPKTIVVTPEDGQKIRFNQDDYKNLSYTHSQLVGNDKITGYLQPNNPNVGTRKFGLGTLSAGKNYELTLSNDKYVEIIPIPLTIQAIDQSYNTAKNVFSGMGAKDNFNRKSFNIIKDKNLKYPDQILYAGGLGIENERDLQFITAPTGKYAITEGDLNFYGNYDIDFIPATYTVYTQYPNPILDRIIRVGDKIIGMPEGIALDTAYPVVDGVVEGVQGAGYWVARSVKDAEGLPTGQAALVIIWGGVAALGEVASAGLTVATLDKASAVVLVVKGFGTYTIKNTQFLTGWTNEQVQQYVKAYQNTVDILNMLRSTKDWYSLIRSDDPQAKAKFFKDLRKRGKSDKEIREAYNYFRSLGANGQNIEVMLNADNILSTAYDMLSFTQDNFPETLDKIPTFILEKLE